MDVLPKRFGELGLTLHPEKTRLIPFQPPARTKRPEGPEGPPSAGTFDLLGFTHCWGRPRNGIWVVKRKTAKDRLARALTRVADWCRIHRRLSVKEQWRALVQRPRGHFGCYGIIGDSIALARSRTQVTRAWERWLGRRPQRGFLSWREMARLLVRYPLQGPRLSARALPA